MGLAVGRERDWWEGKNVHRRRFRRRRKARDGAQWRDVVALVDGVDATLKQFYQDGDQIRLEPANPAVETIRRRADQVLVQGVVIGVIRKY